GAHSSKRDACGSEISSAQMATLQPNGLLRTGHIETGKRFQASLARVLAAKEHESPIKSKKVLGNLLHERLK
ncbi:hypothetical protein L9F63_000652, partial [Diploptera punctata]